MIRYGGAAGRVLDFDIENRPLSYLGMDFTTSEITAIAWAFVGDHSGPTVWMLGQDDPRDMLDQFVQAYHSADLVTGHYIRNHDLPIINGSLVEYGMKTLPRKMTCDTKNDLIGFKGVSKSQENLSEMLGIEAPKIHMNTERWRIANGRGGTITNQALALTQLRVAGDVTQHIQLRAKLLELDRLKEPKPWG